ncbi:MAG TPA: TIGR02281 family clan AA aspartic protease [Burkholderiaceae bacterium]
MPPLPRRPFLALCVSLLVAGQHTAWAQSTRLALVGILGGKALLVVDAAPPRTVAVGESLGGVKVIAVRAGDVDVQVDGQRATLRLGESPVSVAGRSAGGGQRTVLLADRNGHFVQDGQINGQAVRFMVDTGASVVAIGQTDADHLGLIYANKPAVRVNTANGTAQGWQVKLDSIKFGNTELLGVDALVTSQPMPYVLLGNNFLNQFRMTRQSDQMVLEQRF